MLCTCFSLPELLGVAHFIFLSCHLYVLLTTTYMTIKHDALFPVVFESFQHFHTLGFTVCFKQHTGFVGQNPFWRFQGKWLKDSNSVFMVDVLVFLLLRLLWLSISFSLKNVLLWCVGKIKIKWKVCNTFLKSALWNKLGLSHA